MQICIMPYLDLFTCTTHVLARTNSEEDVYGLDEAGGGVRADVAGAKDIEQVDGVGHTEQLVSALAHDSQAHVTSAAAVRDITCGVI